MPDEINPEDKHEDGAHAHEAEDVTNPIHYRRLDPEPIDVIEQWNLGFCEGNAVKYLARAGHKLGADRRDDLAKARWYLDRAMRPRGAETVEGEAELVLVSQQYLEQLLEQLDQERREHKRWEIVARALGGRLREDVDAIADGVAARAEQGNTTSEPNA